jgi:hypothetical protein
MSQYYWGVQIKADDLGRHLYSMGQVHGRVVTDLLGEVGMDTAAYRAFVIQ